VGGPRLPITNPKWRTAAILNHRQRINAALLSSPCKNRKSSNRCMILTLDISNVVFPLKDGAFGSRTQVRAKSRPAYLTTIACLLYYRLLYQFAILDLFLPRDAMHKRGLCCHAVSVRPSVRHVRGHVKTNKHIFEIFYHRVATPF